MKNKNKLFKSFLNKTCPKCKEEIRLVPGLLRKIYFCGCFGKTHFKNGKLHFKEKE
jgi:hypothetical protein